MKNYKDFKRSSSLDLCTIRRSNFNFKSYNSINWVYKLQCECQIDILHKYKNVKYTLYYNYNE